MDTALLGALLEVLLVNIVLSGDNAVVIGLAARGLAPRQRRRAIALGGALAVLLRLALTIPAAALLEIPYLRAGGGLLLAWIAYRLLAADGEADETRDAETLRAAVQLIVLADVTMSLDNVLAVAAVAQRASHGALVLTLGLALSIPVVLVGGSIVASLMRRMPWLAWLGAAVLTYTAADLIVEDRALARWSAPPEAATLTFAAVVTLVVLGLAWLRRRQTADGDLLVTEAVAAQGERRPAEGGEDAPTASPDAAAARLPLTGGHEPSR